MFDFTSSTHDMMYLYYTAAEYLRLRPALCESGRPIFEQKPPGLQWLVTAYFSFSSCDPCCGLCAAHFPPLISARLPVHHMNRASHFKLVFPECTHFRRTRALLLLNEWLETQYASSRLDVAACFNLDQRGFELTGNKIRLWTYPQAHLSEESLTMNAFVFVTSLFHFF